MTLVVLVAGDGGSGASFVFPTLIRFAVVTEAFSDSFAFDGGGANDNGAAPGFAQALPDIPV